MNPKNPTRFSRAVLGLLVSVSVLSSGLSAQTGGIRSRNFPANIEAALKNIPNVQILSGTPQGYPTFIQGDFGTIASPAGRTLVHGDYAEVLEKLRPILRIDPRDLKLRSQRGDSLGMTHLAFDQTKNGLPVVNARLLVHIDKSGRVYAVSGHARDGENIVPVASIDAQAAQLAAQRYDELNREVKSARSTRLLYILSGDTLELHLAYEVEAKGKRVDNDDPIDELVYVDARTGQIVEIKSHVHSAKNREIRNSNFTNGTGTIVRTEGSSPSGNSVYDTNYTYFGTAYDYFTAKFSRDSYDRNGATIVSLTNYREDPLYAYVNAAWIGGGTQRFVFGEGNANWANFVYALDVTAHEFTHAVTEKESGLGGGFEPSALNEAFSDIFGAGAEAYADGAVSSDTWKLAEDIYTPGTSGDAARYMNSPTIDGVSKDYFPDRYTTGGNQHRNAGIVNLAFKLMVTGGQHPRQGTYLPGPGVTIPTTTVTALHGTLSTSLTYAEQIFYRAATVYMTPNTQFMDARAATVQAATDIYGSTVSSRVATAWNVVGVPSYGNLHLVSMVAQSQVGTGNNILIAGFSFTGGSSNSTLIRALGPNNPSSNTPKLSNPELTLYNASAVSVAYNNNWSDYSVEKTAIAGAVSALGLAALPDPSNDAGMLPGLVGNTFTAHISGVSGGTGFAQLELFDADLANSHRFKNMSIRSYVPNGPPLRVEFTISGTGNKLLLLRALGPALTAGGLSGALTDPVMELYDLFGGIGYFRESNDNWGNDPSIVAVSSLVGASSLSSSSADSVLLTLLPAGSYRVLVSGKSGGTGITLFEIYEVY